MRSRTTLILATVALVLNGCGSSEIPVYTRQFTAFDSPVEIRILGASEPLAAAKADEIEQDFQILDRSLTVQRAGALQQVNERLAGDEPFAAPPLLLPLLKRCYTLSEQSGELFNPTIGFLYDLWGFHDVTADCALTSLPEPATLERIVAAAPKLTDLSLNDILLQSDNPAVKLDFRVGAMGYAIDLAMDNLHAQGIRHAVVKIGDNVRALGDRVGQPWRVPLTRPGGAGVIGMLLISGNTSVFTRSDMQRNCLYQGKIYHDVLDPRTGYPVNTVRAVTVLHAGDALTTEVAATALFVAGLTQWAEVAKRLKIDAAALIDSDGTVHLSPEMARQLKVIDRNAKLVVADNWGD
ncbi:FAD:protein FMN transferase [Rhodoferax sp. 4810]|uniref:FAD:protein FMN transferase n=1 Tax=Thiospirillum jenense TaxID=1653858 RepID=A0A839HCQ4_9GAMM|nr:FAD:protein FMN transferase [Thiospirillum jenense]MBB1073849.1 FAD:protein FMN transferase [Rhodoferax jenense]MBB1125196.1 FAD:protein FMN transferase [Thiospirillum jenense]